MTGCFHYEFQSTELDRQLLVGQFDVQTKWCVVSGAPSCGKTTLIDLLAQSGYQTVQESARRFMESEKARGRTINDIHHNAPDLQRRIVDLQEQVEERLPPAEVLFLDGAVPGSLAWYRLFGLDPNEILPRCFHHRYASVFLLDRLPIEEDGIRFADDVHAGFVDYWTYRDYCALGYRVIRVPLLSPKERLAFLLDRFGA